MYNLKIKTWQAYLIVVAVMPVLIAVILNDGTSKKFWDDYAGGLVEIIVIASVIFGVYVIIKRKKITQA